MRSAVERERATWQRKLEQGRAQFRRMAAVVSSAGQLFEKLKVLLETNEHDWTSPPPAALPHFSTNHRSDSAERSFSDHAESPGNLDAALKLSSGERRILTALAQYPQGRSKVQVAVLTGYALNGGGFNNYLGGLRSRGMIQGDGDRLTITDAGMQVLGPWEPLPAGSALIDYWCERLGKAERLILEALTEVYPLRSPKRKWQPKLATNRTAAVSTML